MGLQSVLTNTPVLFSVHVASSFKKITPAVEQKLNKVGLVLPRINQSPLSYSKLPHFSGVVFDSVRQGELQE